MKFKVGDRVRVRNLPGTGVDAGRVGTVVAVERDAPICVVRLDADLANLRPGSDVPFLADELEPEVGGTP